MYSSNLDAIISQFFNFKDGGHFFKFKILVAGQVGRANMHNCCIVNSLCWIYK